jgi:hypothetical protein
MGTSVSVVGCTSHLESSQQPTTSLAAVHAYASAVRQREYSRILTYISEEDMQPCRELLQSHKQYAVHAKALSVLVEERFGDARRCLFESRVFQPFESMFVQVLLWQTSEKKLLEMSRSVSLEEAAEGNLILVDAQRTGLAVIRDKNTYRVVGHEWRDIGTSAQALAVTYRLLGSRFAATVEAIKAGRVTETNIDQVLVSGGVSESEGSE